MKLQSYQIVILSSWGARIVQAFLQIYIIRLLTTILDINTYAIFTLLIVLAGWIILSDFGISLSLQNFISEMKAKNNEYKKYIENALFLGIVIFVFFTIILYPLSFILGPEYLINYNIEYSDKVNLFYLSIFIMLITTVSSIIYKVYFALHKGYISNILPAIGTVISFLLLYIFIERNTFTDLDIASLYYTILIFLLPQALLPLILLVFFCVKNNFKPSYDKIITNQILKRSFQFWIFAFLSVLILQFDYMVASQYLNSQDIVLYNTLSKLYVLCFFIYNSILMALWPVISEHLHKHEWEQVFKYIKMYIPLGFLFVIGFTVLLYFLNLYILNILIKNATFSIHWSILVSFSIYFCIRVWSDTYSMILQSINILKPFWIIVPIQAILSISLQIVLTKIYGMNGLLYGLILSFFFTTVWYLPYKVNKLFQSNKGVN